MWTLALTFEQVVKLLVFVTILAGVQTVILTFKIAQIHRLMVTLLHTMTALNLAVNPWAGEDEPTEPGYHHPPQLKRRGRHISLWFAQLQRRAKSKRHSPE